MRKFIKEYKLFAYKWACGLVASQT